MSTMNPLQWRSGQLFLGAGVCLALAAVFYISSTLLMFSRMREIMRSSRESISATLASKPGDRLSPTDRFELDMPDPISLFGPTLLLSLPSWPLGIMGITGIVLGCIRYAHELKIERDKLQIRSAISTWPQSGSA